MSPSNVSKSPVRGTKSHTRLGVTATFFSMCCHAARKLFMPFELFSCEATGFTLLTSHAGVVRKNMAGRKHRRGCLETLPSPSDVVVGMEKLVMHGMGKRVRLKLK